MRSDWSPTTLGDQADLLTGFPFQSDQYSNSSDDVRLLRGDNIAQGVLRWDGVKKWPKANDLDVKEYYLKKGDVVLAMDRPWIEAGLKFGAVTDKDLPALLVQRVARLRGTESLDTRFLRYLVGSPAFTGYVLAVQTGTAVPHISAGQIRAFKFELPPMSEQQSIAAVLGALDDKIELNRRINETVEAIARAIFKSLFSEFAAVSPRDLIQSELGLVPRGWQIAHLGEHAEAIRGLSYNGSGLSSAGMPLHNLNSVYEGGGYKYEGIKHYTGDFKKRHLLKPGDIILANTEQGFDYLLIGYPAIVPRHFGEQGLFSHHLFRVTPRPGSPITRHFLYYLLMTPSVRDQMIGCTNGTTVNALSADGLTMPRFALPPATLIHRFEAIAAPINRLIETNTETNETLSALRDTLLPKLISGEIRIGQVSRAIGALL